MNGDDEDGGDTTSAGDTIKIGESGNTLPATTLDDADGMMTVDAADSAATTDLIGEPEAELLPLRPDERYVFTRAIGQGGMGEIHLCNDRQIGRDVAMKVIRQEHGAKHDVRARFLREARVQGQLEHPAIVPVYDLARNEQGAAFFTMKRVRGETLESIIELLGQHHKETEREYTVPKLLALFVRICLAVDFAHTHGVLHRDLKPANVMLGRFGEVYVLDWGLAKLVAAGPAVPADSADAPPPQSRVHTDNPSSSSSSSSSSKQTALGSILGTPAYMAPEQIRGEPEQVDHRTDVYALGAILFEILTLQPLHGSDSPRAMLRRALEGVEARTSVRAPDKNIPPELEAICVRATQCEAADRYDSARALAAEVEAYLNGDRDMTLRQALARRHLENAQNASQAADRTAALSEIGRSIALTPEDPAALAVLIQLLTNPPESPPTEVLDDVEHTRVASQRKMLRLASVMYSGVGVALVLVALALGVADWTLACIPPLAWLSASVVAFLGARFDHRPGSQFRYVTIAAAISIALTTLFHGALILVPMLAAVNAMGNVLTTPRANRTFVLVMNGLAVVVPALLVWLGLHPIEHRFFDPPQHHQLDVMGGALDWPRLTLPVLTAVHTVIVFMAARWGARYRDALTAAETRNAMMSWQLRRLVPSEAITRISQNERRIGGS